jgi:hypothetical protein
MSIIVAYNDILWNLVYTIRPRTLRGKLKGLIDYRRDITESRVNGATRVFTEQKHSATPIGKLKDLTVKESGSLGKLAIDALHTIYEVTSHVVLTQIKLETTYQIFLVVKAHRFF